MNRSSKKFVFLKNYLFILFRIMVDTVYIYIYIMVDTVCILCVCV